MYILNSSTSISIAVVIQRRKNEEKCCSAFSMRNMNIRDYGIRRTNTYALICVNAYICNLSYFCLLY